MYRVCTQINTTRMSYTLDVLFVACRDGNEIIILKNKAEELGWIMYFLFVKVPKVELSFYKHSGVK